MGEPPVHPDVRIGHVHLRVSDLERSTAFYRDVLGFDVTLFGPDIGITAAWLAAGGYHHHIALNTWTSAGGSPAPLGHTGLDHVAILYPNRHELARAARRVLEHGHALTSAERDSVRVAVYLRDPDGNGLELYCDRLAMSGRLSMANRVSHRPKSSIQPNSSRNRNNDG